MLQSGLDPAKLVFLDETGTNTKMARLRGRSPRGERCRASIPHGHWETTTLVAGLRLDGLTAPGLLNGAMDGETFALYAEHFLAPIRPSSLKKNHSSKPTDRSVVNYRDLDACRPEYAGRARLPP